MLPWHVAILCTVGWLTCQQARGERILFLPAIRAASHAKSMMSIAQSLQEDNHEVTMLLFLPKSEAKVDCLSVTCVYIEAEEVSKESYSEIWQSSGANLPLLFKAFQLAVAQCLDALNDAQHSKLFEKITQGYWNLLIVDNVLQPCGLFMANKLNVPYIDFSTTLLLRHTRTARGIDAPPSVQPSIGVHELSVKSFWSRVRNVKATMEETVVSAIFRALINRKVAKTVLGRLEYDRFHKNALYTFTSMPNWVDLALPQSFNTIQLQYDCPKCAALTGEYLNFVEANHSLGTIVISFGHTVRWDNVPAKILHAFVNALSRFERYKVVWQLDAKSTSLPQMSHVKVEKWIPLSALLKHRKTIAFVGHAGIKSLLEAICYGTPMVFVPFFADQYRNTVNLAGRRVGTFLDKRNLNADSIYNAIVRVISNSSYKESQRKNMQIINDVLMDSKELAKHWIKFSFRHAKLAEKIRLKCTDESYVSVNCFDVTAFVLLIVFCGSFILSSA